MGCHGATGTGGTAPMLKSKARPDALLLYINDVIPEDEVLDAQSLPKVRMPIGDRFASLPEWKPRTRRLKGYLY
jgi:hypothetical protein